MCASRALDIRVARILQCAHCSLLNVTHLNLLELFGALLAYINLCSFYSLGLPSLAPRSIRVGPRGLRVQR